MHSGEQTFVHVLISIHALREEGDGRHIGPASFRTDFYPRPPRGGRPLTALQKLCADMISIHALREEGDSPGDSFFARPRNFYPRPPRGGRLHFGQW